MYIDNFMAFEFKTKFIGKKCVIGDSEVLFFNPLIADI